MSLNSKKTTAPIYAVGITCLIYGLFLPLYKISHFLILIFLCALVYFLVKGFAKSGFDNSAEPIESDSKDPKLSAAIQEANSYLSQIKVLNNKIPGEEISKKIYKIEALVEKIFSVVAKDTKSLPNVRKMLSYYLPTTVKLLNSYNTLDNQKVSTQNISATMASIEKALDTIIAAFEKQLDALFGDTALEISTDITVLETIMSQEGLLQNENNTLK